MQRQLSGEGFRIQASGRLTGTRAIEGLLICGVLSSLLYVVAIDVIAALRYSTTTAIRLRW